MQKLLCTMLLFAGIEAKANLPDLPRPKVEPISKVLWTNDSLPSEGKAFRDILMEKVVKSNFHIFFFHIV